MKGCSLKMGNIQNVFLKGGRFDKEKTFDLYKEYIAGEVPLERLLEEFLKQSHLIVKRYYSKTFSDFDRDDLISVGIAKLSLKITDDSIFNVPAEDSTPAMMSSFSFVVMHNAMRDFFRAFDLQAVSKWAKDRVYWDYRRFCLSSNISNTPEKILDIKTFIKNLPPEISDFMLERDRFGLGKNLIYYYAIKSVKGMEVLPVTLRRIFKREYPRRDLIVLKVLFKWALFELDLTLHYLFKEEFDLFQSSEKTTLEDYMLMSSD